MRTSLTLFPAVVSVCFFLAAGMVAWAEPSSTGKAPVEAATQPPPKKSDPLAGTLAVDPAVTGKGADEVIAKMLPARTDSEYDWQAGLEPLHYCGEPRRLPPCVPPPPCHPAMPPQPYDLIGVNGMPTNGPRYRGPCCPKTGTHDDGPLPHLHRLHDRAFDWFYRTK